MSMGGTEWIPSNATVGPSDTTSLLTELGCWDALFSTQARESRVSLAVLVSKHANDLSKNFSAPLLRLRIGDESHIIGVLTKSLIELFSLLRFKSVGPDFSATSGAYDGLLSLSSLQTLWSEEGRFISRISRWLATECLPKVCSTEQELSFERVLLHFSSQHLRPDWQKELPHDTSQDFCNATHDWQHATRSVTLLLLFSFIWEFFWWAMSTACVVRSSKINLHKSTSSLESDLIEEQLDSHEDDELQSAPWSVSSSWCCLPQHGELEQSITFSPADETLHGISVRFSSPYCCFSHWGLGFSTTFNPTTSTVSIITLVSADNELSIELLSNTESELVAPNSASAFPQSESALPSPALVSAEVVVTFLCSFSISFEVLKLSSVVTIIVPQPCSFAGADSSDSPTGFVCTTSVSLDSCLGSWFVQSSWSATRELPSELFVVLRGVTDVGSFAEFTVDFLSPPEDPKSSTPFEFAQTSQSWVKPSFKCSPSSALLFRQ